MNKTSFDIITDRGDTFISKQSLLKYLADELNYTVLNGEDSELEQDFVRGMVFTIAAITEHVSKIGK